jgi:hypothetical protein
LLKQWGTGERSVDRKRTLRPTHTHTHTHTHTYTHTHIHTRRLNPPTYPPLTHTRQNPLLTRKKLSPELSKLLKLRREEKREAIEAALLDAIRQRQWFLPNRPGWVVLDAEAAKALGLPHGQGAGDEAGRTMRLVELNGRVEGE